jgi:hypothetical protein
MPMICSSENLNRFIACLPLSGSRLTSMRGLFRGAGQIALCIIDEAGVVRLEKSLPSEIDDIVAGLRDFGEEIACVGLEAGTLTQWLTYGLRVAGFKAVCWKPGTCKRRLSPCATRPIGTTRAG